jgi:hypothetical protein
VVTHVIELSVQVAIETEATSLEEITSPQPPSVPSALHRHVSALEDKIDAMQPRLSAFEKDSEDLKGEVGFSQ